MRLGVSYHCELNGCNGGKLGFGNAVARVYDNDEMRNATMFFCREAGGRLNAGLSWGFD